MDLLLELYESDASVDFSDESNASETNFSKSETESTEERVTGFVKYDVNASEKAE